MYPKKILVPRVLFPFGQSQLFAIYLVQGIRDGDTIYSGPGDQGPEDPGPGDLGPRDPNWHALCMYIR